MHDLFSMDLMNYDPAWPRFCRPSVRAVIRKGELMARVYSQKYDYYKTPGGGLEKGESDEAALIREVREETGLSLQPDSIRPLGRVRRIQADSNGEALIFEQENRYYLCSVGEGVTAQELDEYEAAEGFALRFVRPEDVIETNRTHPHQDADPVMIDREARVMELLLRRSQRM